MAYIGKTPVVGNFVKLDAITTSATATYNLLNGGVAYSPQSANHCIVSLNGVIQSPNTSFTISGSTIVFASALTATDVIDFILVLGDVLNIGTPSDATVTNAKLALTAGSAGTPTISPAADTNTGIFFPAADTIGFAEGGTEVMRITSDGRLGIGLSTTAEITTKLTVSNPTGLPTSTAANAAAIFKGDSGLGNGGAIGFDYDSDSTHYPAGIGYNITSNSNYTNGALVFSTRSATTDTVASERMRINSSGNVLIGNTITNPQGADVNGIAFLSGGISAISALGAIPFAINRGTDDGTLINLSQAGSTEGSISVSGATVSYNGFTGSHWSRFIDESKPDVLRGTVMESLDQMTDWYNVEFTNSENNLQKKPYALKANEQEGDVITYNFEGTDYQATIVKQVDVKHMMSKISDTSEAKNVYGVFHAWDNDDLINNDFYVASVGSYVVRIKAGQTVSKGDLLQSNGDGTAKVQADDIIRASTFAKVLSNTVIQTYEDGSFIVPCSLMC
jgi:hypothetical protein